MKTTLTIDDDIATALETLRQHRNANYDELVNEALRLGVQQMKWPAEKSEKRFTTREMDLGPCLLGDNLDNIAEVLALVEGEIISDSC